MEMSTGSGTCAGLPIVPTSRALHAPSSACLMSHSFEVSAAAVIAQFWPGASWLHGLQVPYDHRAAKVLHRLGILDHVSQLTHVMPPTGKTRSQEDVLGRIDRYVVTVPVTLDPAYRGGWHVILGDQRAFVAVQRHPGHAAPVGDVREVADQHPSWQRIKGMRADEFGLRRQVGDGANQLRFGRIGADVEDIDLAVVQSARPEKLTIVGETHVMRFAAPTDRYAVNDLAVGLRRRVRIDSDEFVGPVAQAFYAEGPDVNEIFLALDEVTDIRGVTGLIRERLGYCGAQAHAHIRHNSRTLR